MHIAQLCALALGFGDNYVERNNTTKFSVKRDNNRVIFESKSGNQARDQVINRYIFDLSKGGNLVAFYAESEYINGVASIDYEAHKGLWVPISHSFRQVNLPNNGQPGITILRDTKLNTIKLNEELDPKIFTVENLGVKPGNWVVDRRHPSNPITFEYSSNNKTSDLLDMVAMLTGQKEAGVPATQGADSRPAADVNEQTAQKLPRQSPPSQAPVATGRQAYVYLVLRYL